jgi:fructose-1,6-bisphosphatase-3
MKLSYSNEKLNYLRLLSKQYPTVQAASAEIINLRAILNLPKGTEHFISDIHGEYEAFLHILNSCSGEVKDKLDQLFENALSQRDRNDLATLIYYPSAKLTLVADENEDMEEWYRITLHRLVQICRFVSVKYTRNKVRSALTLPIEFRLEKKGKPSFGIKK